MPEYGASAACPVDGFESKLTTFWWAAQTKVFTDTALRDITDLVKRGIPIKDEAGGRSTRYSLVDQARDEPLMSRVP